MEINVEKTKVMRIWREHLQYRLLKENNNCRIWNISVILGRLITDARLMREITSWIARVKASNKQKTFNISQLDYVRKKLVKCYIWSIVLYSAETWIFKKNTADTAWKFWNVVLEEDEEDQLGQSSGKWRSITQSQGEKEHHTYIKRRKAN